MVKPLEVIVKLGTGALVLALVGGCVKTLDPGVIMDSGVITEKRYEQQREYVKSGVGPAGKFLLPYEIKMVDDEDFIIVFGRDDGVQFKSMVVYVSKEVYYSLNIGDTFDASKFPHEASDQDYSR